MSSTLGNMNDRNIIWACVLLFNLPGGVEEQTNYLTTSKSRTRGCLQSAKSPDGELSYSTTKSVSFVGIRFFSKVNVQELLKDNVC